MIAQHDDMIKPQINISYFDSKFPRQNQIPAVFAGFAFTPSFSTAAPKEKWDTGHRNVATARAAACCTTHRWASNRPHSERCSYPPAAQPRCPCTTLPHAYLFKTPGHHR